jgi:uncharacterized membrane protein (DUF4010 family)
MFDNSRQPWANDPRNLTLVVVIVAVVSALCFIAMQGWS